MEKSQNCSTKREITKVDTSEESHNLVCGEDDHNWSIKRAARETRARYNVLRKDKNLLLVVVRRASHRVRSLLVWCDVLHIGDTCLAHFAPFLRFAYEIGRYDAMKP